MQVIAAQAIPLIVNTALDGLIDTLTPGKHEEGDRVDFQPLTGLEGRPVYTAMGQYLRVGGNVIYISDVIEVANTSEISSDKKGEPDTKTTYEYFVHMAVGICKGEIVGVSRIWANGRMIYQNGNYMAGLITGPMTLDITTGELFGPGTMGISFNTEVGVFQRSGSYEAIVTGCNESANNGTFPVLGYSGYYDAVGDAYQAIMLYNPDAIVEAADTGVQVEQVPWELAPWAGNEVTFYPGSQTQGVDPLLSAQTGSSIPYHGIAYAVFNRFALREWGHRIPQLTFEIVQKVGATAEDVVIEIMTVAGFESEDFDASALTEIVKGTAWKGKTQSVEPLAPLLKAYDYVLADHGEEIVFHGFHDGEVIEVSEKFVGCHDGVQGKEPKLRITDVNDADLPDEVNVQYIDIDTDYQTGSQRERRNTVTDGTIQSINLPIVLTAGEARHITTRALYRAWKHRQTIEISLPLKYGYIGEHDKLQVTIEGLTYYIHVLQVDIGYNWLVQVKGYLEESGDDT